MKLSLDTNKFAIKDVYAITQIIKNGTFEDKREDYCIIKYLSEYFMLLSDGSLYRVYELSDKDLIRDVKDSSFVGMDKNYAVYHYGNFFFVGLNNKDYLDGVYQIADYSNPEKKLNYKEYRARYEFCKGNQE